MAFTTVLWDLDNTLLDFDASAHAALGATLHWLGVEAKPEYFQSYRAINDRLWTLLEEGAIDLPELKRRRFSSLLAYIGKEGDPLEVNRQYLDFLAQQTHLIPGVKPVLQAMQLVGVRMGVITNGLSAVQAPRLRRTGLDVFFEAVIVSEEIGVAKPFPAFFSHALQAMQIEKTEEVLVIGDNPGSDILGGQQSGLATCWFNPKGRENPLPMAPDFEVRQLSEIPPLVFD